VNCISDAQISMVDADSTETAVIETPRCYTDPMKTQDETPLEIMRRQAAMTVEEREQEIEKRQRVVDGMLRWIHEDNREPTQREQEQLQHNRNVISSLKLGIENERARGNRGATGCNSEAAPRA
jgi:hypothetical protein